MLGEYLKSHREKLNLTLNDISALTKISPKHLLSIENNEFNKIPGELFVRSFIKEYAKSVSIDPAEALRLYAETVKPVVQTDVITVKTESNNKSILYIVLSLIILAGVIYFVYNYPTNEPKDDANIQEKESPTISSSVAPEKNNTTPKPVTPEPITPEPLKPEPITSSPVSPDTQITAKENTLPKLPDTQKIKDIIKEKITDISKPEDSKTEVSNNHELKITALSDSWLYIKVDNEKTFDMILKAGESKRWRADKIFFIKTGNAAGINVIFDGKELGVLGNKGEVKTLILPEKTSN